MGSSYACFSCHMILWAINFMAVLSYAPVTHYLLVSVMSCCTDFGFLLSGKPSFTKKQADLFFPPDFPDDFPVSMQVRIFSY